MFFFQAEDGIRDLVRSRGLGDVYKRQPQNLLLNNYILAITNIFSVLGAISNYKMDMKKIVWVQLPIMEIIHVFIPDSGTITTIN